MNTVQPHCIETACGAPAPQAGLHPWLKLAAGILAVLLFIFGVGSLAQYLPGARHMARVIDERGLRATAIYYTDFEESADGAWEIYHSLEYGPRPAAPPAE